MKHTPYRYFESPMGLSSSIFNKRIQRAIKEQKKGVSRRNEQNLVKYIFLSVIFFT